MSVRQKIPEPVKEVYRFFRRGKDMVQAQRLGKLLIEDPNKHALFNAKMTKSELVRPFNMDKPITFSEKMAWLKYNLYNDSPLIAQCYNKYEVRHYIQRKGLERILNELYGVWDSVDEIPWDDLPDEYAMKITNGYAGHVFKRKGEPFSIAQAKKTLKKSKKRYDYYYKVTGDLFVANTKQRIICEKMLYSNLGYLSPEDYKFYCFNGEPLFVEFMAGRSGGASFEYSEVFVDIDLNDRNELEKEAHPGTFEAPKCYNEMIEMARILSADFPFVRVDFYVEDDHPIFGELTFTPTHYHTVESEVELGGLLNLKDAKVTEE